MSDLESRKEVSRPLTGLQAALAEVAERRRKDPNWNARFDSTYAGPFYFRTLEERMTEADYADWLARKEADRKRWEPRPAQVVPQECPPPVAIATAPRQPVVRMALPLGQRIRDLRRALGWTQRHVASQLGVSARTVIRYEQGHSSPLRVAPLLALRRLESAHALELDCWV